MSLTLRIIDSPEGEAVREWQKIFPKEGGTLGRSNTSTMVLSDLSRTVSGTHAIVIKSPSGYRVVDTSTNGLYINGAKDALGLQNQAALNDGDVIDLGGYRLLVSCFQPDQAEAKDSPLESWKEYDPFAAAADSSQAMKADDTNTADPFSAPRTVNEGDDDRGIKNQEVLKDSLSFNNDSYSTISQDPFTEKPEDDIKTGNPSTEGSQAALMSDQLDSFEQDENGLFAVNSTQPSYYQMDNTSAVFDQVSRYDKGRTTVKISNLSRPEANENTSHALTTSVNLIDDKIITIIEMAFARFLKDLSPEAIEKMADDLSCRGKLFKKPDYWKFYGALFSRQHETSEWSLKFKAYLLEGQRLMRYMK